MDPYREREKRIVAKVERLMGGMSKAKLARLAGIEPQTLRRQMKRGRLDTRNVLRLADALGIPAEELVRAGGSYDDLSPEERRQLADLARRVLKQTD